MRETKREQQKRKKKRDHLVSISSDELQINDIKFMVESIFSAVEINLQRRQ